MQSFLQQLMTGSLEGGRHSTAKAHILQHSKALVCVFMLPWSRATVYIGAMQLAAAA